MNFYLQKQLITTFTPHQSTNLSNSDNNEYIFDVILSYDNNNLAASRSDNSLLIIDSNQFNIVSKIKAHSDRINHIEYSTQNPYLIFSASDDNKVCIWDQRIFNKSISTIYQSNEVLSLAVGADGYLLATSYESSILFYDIRYLQNSTSGNNENATKLGQYADVHSDIVTHLKFHPINKNILTSASEDGLICTYDTSVKETEESVITILNTECPISKFGYFSENKEGIYVISTIETLSCWHYPSAQRIIDFPNIRTDFNVDYLVDCFEVYNNEYSSELCLLVGNYSGSGSVIKIEPSQSKCIGNLSNTNGHVANIRCCIANNSNNNSNNNTNNSNNNSNNIIFTGGEDARICKWGINYDSTNSIIKDNNNSNNLNVRNTTINSKDSRSSNLSSSIATKVKSSSSEFHFKPY